MKRQVAEILDQHLAELRALITSAAGPEQCGRGIGSIRQGLLDSLAGCLHGRIRKIQSDAVAGAGAIKLETLFRQQHHLVVALAKATLRSWRARRGQHGIAVPAHFLLGLPVPGHAEDVAFWLPADLWSLLDQEPLIHARTQDQAPARSFCQISRVMGPLGVAVTHATATLQLALTAGGRPQIAAGATELVAGLRREILALLEGIVAGYDHCVRSGTIWGIDHECSRFALALMNHYPDLAWRAKQSHSGRRNPGRFLAGLLIPAGGVAFWLPDSAWTSLNNISTLSAAPPCQTAASAVTDRLAAWNASRPANSFLDLPEQGTLEN